MKVELPDMDRDKKTFIHDLVINGQSFTKKYNFTEDVIVVMRTHKGYETSEVIKRTAKNDNGLVMIQTMNDCNLAFSLVSINEMGYDKGTLDERLKIIEEFPTPKKSMLWNVLSKFNEYVDKLRKEVETF